MSNYFFGGNSATLGFTWIEQQVAGKHVFNCHVGTELNGLQVAEGTTGINRENVLEV